MNIFRILASAERQALREEFISAFLAYLLSPSMDHGLGAKVLSSLLHVIGEQQRVYELTDLASQLDSRLREDLFSDSAKRVRVDLELHYTQPGSTKYGYIDVIVRLDQWFIAIENKILTQSHTQGQLAAQYTGLRQVLEQKGHGDHHILMLYLVPADPDVNGWALRQCLRDELKFERKCGDVAAIVTWQPVDGEISFLTLIRDILCWDSQGEIAPLGHDIRQHLLAFMDFALNQFRGYPYDRVVEASPTNSRKVANLLTSNDNLYVGVRYGMAGLMRRAWRNPAFRQVSLSISETERGWQYLPLRDFKVLATWAMHPENEPLQGIEWSGTPFWTDSLYLVAKASASSVFIGMQGGLEALKAMSPKEIQERKEWLISNYPRSAQWFSGADFVAVLEAKGVRYDAPIG